MIQDDHNHTIEDETDPLDYVHTCSQCAWIMQQIDTIEMFVKVEYEDVKEFVDVCLYNDRTPDKNLRLLARDNPEFDSIAEFKQIAKLARLQLKTKGISIQ